MKTIQDDDFEYEAYIAYKRRRRRILAGTAIVLVVGLLVMIVLWK